VNALVFGEVSKTADVIAQRDYHYPLIESITADEQR
jgi:hypothetical protein